MRIGCFALFFIGIISGVNVGKEIPGAVVNLPLSARVPMPWMEYYTMHIPVNAAIVNTVAIIFNISVVLGFLGLFTRISTIVYAVLIFYLLSIQLMFGKLVNSQHLFWLPVILACAPAGRVLSVDYLLNRYVFKKPVDTTPSVRFGLPVKLALIMLGILYFFSGFWKVWTGGFDWIFKNNLAAQLYIKWGETDGWLPYWRIDHYPALTIAAGFFAVAFEFGFIFLVVKKRFHPWLLLGGIALHLGIYMFMGISFATLYMYYIMLIDWDKLLKIFTPPAALQNFTATRLKEIVSSNKAIFIAGLVLISGNLLYGFAKVNSWPFACYPTFDELIAPTFKYVRYEGYNGGAPAEAHGQIRKRIQKLYPDYYLRGIEYKVLDGFHANDTLKVQHLVHTIFSVDSNFAGLDSVRIYEVEGGIAPEQRDSVWNKQYITTYKR